MLTPSLCMILELSELGIIGNGCLMVHQVGMHTVTKYIMEREVRQQLVEVQMAVRQYLCLRSEGSYSTV